MTAVAHHHDLPPHLHALYLRAKDLQDVVRDALLATLSVTPHHATPEQVLAHTFGRLGYLPDAAKAATRTVLA
jgi:hypothetical protein